MGEKIRDLGKVQLGGAEFTVELNHSAGGGKYRDIHIQNEKFRLEMPENEFMQMAACVMLASRQLKKIKNLEDAE